MVRGNWRRGKEQRGRERERKREGERENERQKERESVCRWGEG